MPVYQFVSTLDALNVAFVGVPGELGGDSGGDPDDYAEAMTDATIGWSAEVVATRSGIEDINVEVQRVTIEVRRSSQPDNIILLSYPEPAPTEGVHAGMTTRAMLRVLGRTPRPWQVEHDSVTGVPVYPVELTIDSHTRKMAVKF